MFLLIGSCIRIWQTVTLNYYVPNYFKVYPQQADLFQYTNAAALFLGCLLANIISAGICELFDQYAMTKPLICVVKALIDIPCCAFVFLQQDNFWLSMVSLFCQYLLGRGWSAPAISMLQTVVDPSIKGITISIYLFVSTVISSFSSVALGELIFYLNLSPEKTPKEYGQLIAYSTIIPCIICIPFFLLSGFKYRQIKLAEKEKSEGHDKDENNLFTRQLTVNNNEC